MAWWYPYRGKTAIHYMTGKITDYQLPDDSRKPVESDVKPEGNWWGPFHCEQCANWCGSYGKLPEQAYRAAHGTDDERFGETLGYFE